MESKKGKTSFTELKCWQKSRVLVNLVYKSTTHIQELGIRDQIRSAALSVMSNIAEGYSRISDKETNRFLNISMASCSEVASILYALQDAEFINAEAAEELRIKTIEVHKMVRGLHSYLQP